MGTAGINSLDREKVFFLIDPSTHYAALLLQEVLTRDVFSNPTIENGQLTRVFGYRNYVTSHMCKASANRLSNSAGKIDLDTAGNNLYGHILAVRPDQWRFGYRRRMTMETTRIPAADAWEIVCHIRAGLINRDTEASAITYNLTV
jgi:hypothetical protein